MRKTMYILLFGVVALSISFELNAQILELDTLEIGANGGTLLQNQSGQDFVAGTFSQASFMNNMLVTRFELFWCLVDSHCSDILRLLGVRAKTRVKFGEVLTIAGGLGYNFLPKDVTTGRLLAFGSIHLRFGLLSIGVFRQVDKVIKQDRHYGRFGGDLIVHIGDHSVTATYWEGGLNGNKNQDKAFKLEVTLKIF